MPTIKFHTLGCKVNQYETQVMREQLLGCGFTEIKDHLPAGTYIINTCTVTHDADTGSFSLIRRAKRENPQARIIVTGCLAELDEDKLKKIGDIDLIIKNKDKHRIAKILKERNESNEIGITYFSAHSRAFLKIQDGCNNFCSYCKVPLVRGRSRSRDLSSIIKEANSLVKNGFKEIVLCGICLGEYGKDLANSVNLVDVIAALGRIDGPLRLRLSSIESKDLSDELIRKMAESKIICRHLHIPLQSGDDDILKKMNRSYSRNEYLRLINKIKETIPEIAITTDVMVGFPGEAEESFQNTLRLIKEISPLRVHIFTYSKREGTAAALKFKQELECRIIKERFQRLESVARDCAFAYKTQFLNKALDVLIEGISRDYPNFLEGYTDNYIKVLIRNNDLGLINKVVAVKLKGIFNDCVLAEEVSR